ncbi:MAG: sigma 54-interacting transcriptional regulator [Pseudomonadota bacterium]
MAARAKTHRPTGRSAPLPGQLLSVLAAIATERKLDSLLERMLMAAIDLTHARSGRLYVLDPTGRQLLCQAASCAEGATQGLAGPVELYSEGRPDHRRAEAFCAFSGDIVQIADVSTDTAFDHAHSADGATPSSLLLVPLSLPDEVSVGVLELRGVDELARPRGISRSRSGPTEREQLLRGFASLAAVAINNARLLDENQRLVTVLDEANRVLERENRQLRERVHGRCDFTTIIGDSPPMQTLFALMEKAAASDVTVLVEGETGAGKELVAWALHENSARRDHRLVAQNCAALPEALLESELFGYERGAFTGATESREGLLRAAHRGTLFLDEIGDLPLALQAKLLRVLEDGEVRPLGSSKSRRVDLRLVAATHHDLQAKVEDGSFRRDLYFRLNVFPLTVPPLRERREDIPALVQHFLAAFADVHGKPVSGITPAAMDLLLRHDFPGNVRELRNVVERAVVLVEPRGAVCEAELPADWQQQRWVGFTPLAQETAPPASLREAMERHERDVIEQALAAHDGNRTRTAQALGISRRSLQMKLVKLDLAEEV